MLALLVLLPGQQGNVLSHYESVRTSAANMRNKSQIMQSKKRGRKCYQTRIFENKATQNFLPPPCDQLEVGLDAYLSTTRIFANKKYTNNILLSNSPSNITTSEHDVAPEFVHEIVVDLVDDVATMSSSSPPRSQVSNSSVISLDDSTITDSFGDPCTEGTEIRPSLN